MSFRWQCQGPGSYSPATRAVLAAHTSCPASLSPTLPCLPRTFPQLQGSSFVNDINDRFTATMTNVVRCRDAQPGEGDEEEGGQEAGAQGGRGAVMKEISSDTTIQVGRGMGCPRRTKAVC